MFIKKRESADLKHFNVSKVFIEYLTDRDDIYKNIKEYNPNRKRKTLIVFHYYLFSYMVHDKNRNTIVTEIFISGRKLFLLLLSHNPILLC